jgi:LysM repeat protein/GH25 family lysozyme M1 (1,4-beta-N-acetylmuramidase)
MINKMKKITKLVTGLALAIGLSVPIVTEASSLPKIDVIDVSHHNNSKGESVAFYQTLKASGVNGAVVKISEGQTVLDQAASVNIANSRISGMQVNAYHFAHFTSVATAQAEAKFFDYALRKDGFNPQTDGYVILDLENSSITNPTTLTQLANTFLQQMINLGYKHVDLYSGNSFYNYSLQPANLLVSDPWIARYPLHPETGQPMPTFPVNKGSWQWSQSWEFLGMESFGYFDVTEDYSGKLSNLKESTDTVQQVGAVSLVNYMKSKGMDFSYDNRAKLAKAYNITDYSGTAAQNIALMEKLKSGVKPVTTPAPKPIPAKTPAPIVVKPAPKPIPKPVVQKTPVKTASVTKYYYVKQGDVLGSIARKFNITIAKLQSLNGLQNPNKLSIGQKLKVSAPVVTVKKITPVQHVSYKVAKGDYVGKISKKFNVSISQIKSLNKLDNQFTIYVGETLKIK